VASAELSPQDVVWELSDLFPDAASARDEWSALLERARALGERFRNRLDTLDPTALRAFLDEVDELEQAVSRVGVYSHLRLSMATTDEEAMDLMTVARDRNAEIESALVFVELEWIALDDDAAERALAAPELAPYAHRLRVARLEKPFVRSEPEEQALNARNPTAGAWQLLHDRHTSTLEVPFDPGDGEEPHTISRLLSYLYRPERDLRQRALVALYDGLEPRADVLAACYDALVGDRLSVDRLRGYAHPLQPTNIRNELEDEIVEALLSATEERYDIGRRWFETKAPLLGLDRLELADQYAPLGVARPFAWPEAVACVDTAFTRFTPRFAEIFRACLDSGHVDAAPRPAKAGGAYCAEVAKDVLPYVLLNFTEQLSDVGTLAHEFGHAICDVLALEQQTWRSHRLGLPMAEVPSTFAEALSDDYLLETESDAPTRATLAADRLENAFGAVFRQTVLARFEQRAYALRGEGKSLSAERLSDVWLEENARYYGESLVLPERYRLGWSYVPHFVHTRFYTYAYAFAQLLALLLHRRYRDDPEAFIPKYVALLAAGGSASPAELVAPFGLDLRSTDTWREGLAELDLLREQAEAAGDALRG
jgi:oligoendopeptidase F